MGEFVSSSSHQLPMNQLLVVVVFKEINLILGPTYEVQVTGSSSVLPSVPNGAVNWTVNNLPGV